MIYQKILKTPKETSFKVKLKKIETNRQKELKSMKDKKKNIGVSYEQSDLDPEERRKLEQLQDKIYTKGFTDEQMSQVGNFKIKFRFYKMKEKSWTEIEN
jgi:hypothetical protein